MSTYLQLVQLLHSECKQPGSAPTAVTGQTGRAADFVRWIAEAWNDIQREQDGKWLWLRRKFNFNTSASTQNYAYSSVTDTAATAAIARFRAWDLDVRRRPTIYLVSDGQSTQRWLNVMEDYGDFRYLYNIGSPSTSYPGSIAVNDADELELGPVPDDTYRVDGYYWRGNQTLSADADEPECPADYHNCIVYRAMVKYAYNTVAQESLVRATAEGGMIYEALVLNQAYKRRSLTVGPALA